MSRRKSNTELSTEIPVFSILVKVCIQSQAFIICISFQNQLNGSSEVNKLFFLI